MSIVTKVLIGLVVVAVFPLVYYAAAVLKVHQAWHEKVARFEVAVAQQEQENFTKLHGDPQKRTAIHLPGRPSTGTPGVKQLETVRDNLKLGRGRFWYAQRDAQLIDQDGGTFKVQIVDDNIESDTRQPLKEHGIKDKSFLYLFQLQHDGEPSPGDDRYIGEFVVGGLTLDENGLPTDALVPLRPSVPFTTQQWDALAGGSGSWIIYEHMPIDDHEVFSNLSEDEIRARLPASVADEYVYDDKPPSDAVLADPKLQAFVAEDPDTGAKKFLRPLRDYQQIFRNIALRSTEISDRLVILNKEKQYADQAKLDVEALLVSLDARKSRLQEEMARLEAETTLARTQLEKVESSLAEVKQQLQARLAETRRLAEETAAPTPNKTAARFLPNTATARTP